MEPRPEFSHYFTNLEDRQAYVAGLPSYPRDFFRDVIISGIISADRHLLHTELESGVLHQGKQFDPITGEEPGKIHHEYPGTYWRKPYLTTYNACDTTALYLIGIEILGRIDPELADQHLETHSSNVETALQYLDRHIKDNLFWEFPPPGAEQFSVRHTYWKDSIPPYPSGKEEPKYPVTFALAHFQAARGILAAARLLERKDLKELADTMFKKGIAHFMTERAFIIEQDQEGTLEMPSSDELHSLAYIPEKYWAHLPLVGLEARALNLLTPAGIACTPREVSERLTDQYHGYKVWIFEQALIHYGVRKFGMREFAQITKECAAHIDTGHELLNILPDITPEGNTHQLWSVAAGVYFSDEPSLRQTDWL